MDLRNHGKSPVTDGRLRMGATEWRDVIAAGKWLDAHQASELPRLVLGASMGGSAAIHAAANGLRIDGMILLDPQLDVFDSLMTGGQVNTGIPAPFFAVAARRHSPLCPASWAKEPTPSGHPTRYTHSALTGLGRPGDEVALCR
ncbi:MAG: hypothetical protein CM15mP74_09860 [Halieaceae bacterium]|nr:MAG: hypothetical protein CM15mP74_09860 [Halieaceae bacterium]